MEVKEKPVLESQEGIQCHSTIEMFAKHKQRQAFLFSDSPHGTRRLLLFTIAVIRLRSLSFVTLVLGMHFSSFYCLLLHGHDSSTSPETKTIHIC